MPQCSNDRFLAAFPGQLRSFRLVDKIPIHRPCGQRRQVFRERRGVEHHRQPAGVRCVDEPLHTVNFVLQQQNVPRRKRRERFNHLFFAYKAVCAAIQQNAVFAAFLHLDDGVSGRSGNGPYIPRVHTLIPQKVQKKHTVRADAACVKHLRARTRQRHRLVEPLAADIALHGCCGARFARLHKPINAVDIVYVQRTEIENFHAPRSSPAMRRNISASSAVRSTA